ncbi:MAG: preprotein translocase subunit SecE [Eubacterium sp.]|nr:preprotein translocase subunit SecE [Eubacterium sp.]
MNESEKKTEVKESWTEGLKQEFNKISWLPAKTVGKQTAAVVVVSVIVGIIIAILDKFIQYGIDFLTGL